MGFFILILVIAVPFVLWGIIDPKGAWRATESWKYKNPEANEPSETSYMLSQIGGVIALIVFVIMGIGLYSTSHDAGSSSTRASGSDSGSGTGEYTMPEMRFTRFDAGPGTLIGYRYPSELTLEFVVLDADGHYAFSGPTCDTQVSVHEQSNAVVVEVTRTARSTNWLDPGAPDPDLSDVCESAEENPRSTSHKLQEPLGDRPILTAAPQVDPMTVDLAPAAGPAQPLQEVPTPGVKQPLTPVPINPAWRPVPLLAVVDNA